MKLVLFALITAVGLFANAYAATFDYEALTDFEDLDSGVVPYYKHTQRDALAINASDPDYRNVFARATTTFDGEAGNYDVTISALGEIDGECEYRFLVNGVVVGTAVNSRVTEDYDIQQHTFTGINIPAGAEIAVESNAVTNGLIPEGVGTAFARGRWSALSITSATPTTPDPIDLSIAASASTTSVNINTEYEVSFVVQNNSTDQTATAPVITLAIPANTTLAPHAVCTTDNNVASCAVAEIGAGSNTTVTFAATTSVAGTVSFNASVSADQTDDNESNNSAAVNVTATDPVAQEPVSVDLALTVGSDTATVTNGQTIEYSLTVRNQHPENTATAPVAGAALPSGLQFSTSADCSFSGQAVSCELPELAPDQTTTVVFSAVATTPGNAAIVASVSANEPETSVSDNEVRYNVVIADNQSTDGEDNQSTTGTQNPSAIDTATETENTGTETQSGGGSADRGLLLMLITVLLLGGWFSLRPATVTRPIAK